MEETSTISTIYLSLQVRNGEPLYEPFYSHCNLYVSQKGSLSSGNILIIFLSFFLLSLNLGGCLPELNEYDHVSEGGAKDAGNEPSLNCEVTPR